MYVFMLLLIEAKYKFVGITHQFNDCFMIIFALIAILLWQKGQLFLSSVMLGIAINIKMSALLLLPGFALTTCIDGRHGGVVKMVISVFIMAAMQYLIGLEFINTNSKAYWSMAYNFDRVFQKVE